MTESKFIQPDTALPKGGGSIKSVDNQFSADSFTGASNFSIPFPFTAGRGFDPSMSIAYSSGSGNGVCGMGVSLTLSEISRKTSKGIPKYNNTDVFLLNGDELVPKLKQDVQTNNWIPDVRQEGNWRITTYRPRIEGSFSSIEYWQSVNSTDSYWKITSSGNHTIYFGKSDSARIFDAAKPEKIFSWLAEEETDQSGNIIQYRYEREESENNTYLKYIHYGNYLNASQIEFAFTTVIDYGTFDKNTPDVIPTGYLKRPDAFSFYNSGFETRHTRLVHHVLQYHRFPHVFNGQPFLVKALQLMYGATDGNTYTCEPYSQLSFLRSIAVTGYAKQTDGSYQTKSIPPFELSYSTFKPISQNYQTLQVIGADTIPGYLTNNGYQLIDLNNDGLPGFLYSDANTSFYFEPLGEGKYAAPVELKNFPVERNLGNEQLLLTSLSGNGEKDVVLESTDRSGYYRNTGLNNWQGFEPFTYQSTESLSQAKQWVDLTGDGLADLLIFEQDAIKFYPSLQTLGYGKASRIPLTEGFPATENNSEVELLSFVNLVGDGLQHYVRVRNGSVEYWPNLGYGHFGHVKRLKNAPYLEEGMDIKRVRFADIDGSGTADFIYLEHNHVKIWFNQNGNAFSAPIEIPLPVNYDQLSQISFADVNGTGTTCLIITVTEPEVKHYYYDFSGGKKPYLLDSSKNNLGTTAKYHYSTSVKQFLHDKREGRIWPTRLFFPVHVIERTEVLDEPSGAYHVQRFAYHDGFYDPVERVFNGFGYIETWDTDHFESYAAGASNTGFPVKTVNAELHATPVYTKSWYHNGAYEAANRTQVFYRQAYFKGDASFHSISGQVLDSKILTADAETLRQAYAAMKGQLLRQEVYGLDNSPLMPNPFTVDETEIYIRLEQPRQQNRYAVFFVHERQSINWHYERNPADPRVSHNFTTEINEWGAATQTCSIAYPRRNSVPDFVFEEQKQLKLMLSSSSVVSTADEDAYYLNVPIEDKNYEILGASLPSSGYFSFEAIMQTIDGALNNIIDYNAITYPFTEPVQLSAMLLDWQQNYYWKNDQTEALPLGQISTPLLAHHNETAVYPENTFDSYFSGLLTADDILNSTGYITHDHYYWNTSEVQYYLPADAYFLPEKQQNDFAPVANTSLNTKSSVTYDMYCLRTVSNTSYLSDSIAITTASEIDYLTMKAWRTVDANENVAEVLFDPLGYVIVNTVYGQLNGKATGYLPLSDYTIVPATVNDVIAQPENYLQQTAAYYYYDTFAWMDRKEPVCAISLASQLYTSQVKKDEANPIKIGLAFSDGMGRALLTKTNTNAGSIGVLDKNGNWLYSNRPNDTDWSNDRWVCAGHTVYNNKGNPVQQFQAYFSDGWAYQPVTELIQTQQIVPPSVIHYDALDRVIKTFDPKGFFTAVSFTPWESKTYDENDTICDSPYYQSLNSDALKAEGPALQQAMKCYNSPATVVYDTLGNTVRSMIDNLGVITAETLQPVLLTESTIQTALNELLTAGWIVQDKTNANQYWLTDTFQPYTKHFATNFTIGGVHASAILNILKQGRLTTLQVLDIQGRTLESIDPRLLWSNLTEYTDYFNFRYLYTMSGEAIKTLSADFGERTSLSNKYGSGVYYWDARGFKVSAIYDAFQRKCQTLVEGGDGTTTQSRVAEQMVYGETAPNAANFNLIGQVWKVFDNAGVAVVDAYSLAAQALAQQRYFRSDYKTDADWTAQAQTDVLQQTPFEQFSEHNALGLSIREVTPDGSIFLPGYNVGGQLNQLNVLFAHSNTNTDTPTSPVTVVQEATYDPNGQILSLKYGNNTQLKHTFEATTQQLIHQCAYRVSTTKTEDDKRLQDIHYTYDPVGNIVSKWDASFNSLFNGNALIEPFNAYAYNLIYQLKEAKGRQQKQVAKGITRSDQQFMQERHIPMKRTSANDTKEVEDYLQTYTYDDAGNLIELKHLALSKSYWTQAFTIANNSNHTIGHNATTMSYDANGNLQALKHLASIIWNYKNELSKAVVIAREGAESDAEYYQYDSGGNRVRKVTERVLHGGTQKEIHETYYIAGYQYKRISQVSINADGSEQNPSVLLEKQSLKINGPAGLCCMSHYWLNDIHQRETKTKQRVFKYQYCDVLNSVGVEANEIGALLSYEEYYPYGGTAYFVSENAVEVSLKDYRYSGQEKDNFTGLYYYGMRYYPHWLCRWMNPDPAGTIDGLNLYAFVGGNPTTKYDVGGMGGRAVSSGRAMSKLYASKKRKGGKKKAAPKVANKATTTFNYFGNTVTKPPSDFSVRARDLGAKVANEIATVKNRKSLKTLKADIKKNNPGKTLLFEMNEPLQDGTKFDSAFTFGLSKKQAKFESNYRNVQKGQDEFVGTSVVSHFMVGFSKELSALKKNNKITQTQSDAIIDEVKEGIQFVSSHRMPTKAMGARTSTNDFVQHTSGKHTFYGDQSNGGKPLLGEPGYPDRKRNDKALEAAENSKGVGIERLVDMAQAATLYSLTSGFCARPTASNIICNTGVTTKEKNDINALREAGKAQFDYTVTSNHPDAGSTTHTNASKFHFDFDGYNCPSPMI